MKHQVRETGWQGVTFYQNKGIMDHWFTLTSAKTTVVAWLVAWSQISYLMCLIVGNTPLHDCHYGLRYQVIAKSRQRIKQLGGFFLFYFLLFSFESSQTLLTTLAFCIKLFMNDCITHVILVPL